MDAVTPPRPVTGDDRCRIRDQVRGTLEAEVARLKQSTKEAQSANRLLEVLKASAANPNDPTVIDRAKKVVGARIGRLRQEKSAFERAQRRDVVIIIHFTRGNIGLDHLRDDACALLQLNGSNDDIKQICQIYPGLRNKFE